MPSCSVHHCVLFLLTLTTAPVFSITVKLHQPVTLPCEHKCSLKLAQWRLKDGQDVVFAQCDQTSCSSLEGYEMPRDQYLDGDLSLTITKPDYSMRKTYVCVCDNTDYTTWHLRIDTVSSAVQMFPGEDLKLDLSVPESVEVIYRGSDSADGVQICTVTDRTLQCNTEYTPRTSLSNSELTLRNMWRGESGTYTIRNLDYKEDIHVYAVSVSVMRQHSEHLPAQSQVFIDKQLLNLSTSTELRSRTFSLEEL
ncbi:CAP-Gly domain-containing linker protein 1-like isoform X1 [Clarias magur]|uniref:CAP-Gly domain-containing linker protein 1-like isoform X1 n=1 Tax=Clarias magur TaxID=1594786 RepID=A0A8J4T0R4_CLAMG|nr:CAP-Gly domain-containing linker protein 1-like isoform X1 [Clarias magur]